MAIKPKKPLIDNNGDEIITPKLIKERRIYILKEYFDGSIRRLLRKLYKPYMYELVYSKGLKKLPSDIREYLIQCNPWPINICKIYNIYKTLVNKLDMLETRFTMELAKYIWLYFGEDIEEYRTKKYPKTVNNRGFKQNHTAKEALREQKARGFIHINKFEDYKKRYAHVYSNVDRDYIYPMNFWHNIKNKKHSEIMSYHGQYLVGVSGFTSVILPKK